MLATDHPCPQCGKTMLENREKWPGLWYCPDNTIILNDRPPYLRKCTGMDVTQEGCDALEDTMITMIAERN